MNELLNEYCASLAGVRMLIRKAMASNSGDIKQLRAMERDLEWTIEYLTTGYPPQGRSLRSIPVDPQKVLVHFSRPLYEPTLQVERLRLRFLSALNVLSQREKEAFMMVKGEGVSYGEAAKLMGVKKGTVQHYVNRAIEKFVEYRKTLGLRSALEDD